MLDFDEIDALGVDMMVSVIDRGALYWAGDDYDDDDDIGYLTDYLAPMAYRRGDQEIDGLRRLFPRTFKRAVETIDAYVTDAMIHGYDDAGEILRLWEDSDHGFTGHVRPDGGMSATLTELHWN